MDNPLNLEMNKEPIANRDYMVRLTSVLSGTCRQLQQSEEGTNRNECRCHTQHEHDMVGCFTLV